MPAILRASVSPPTQPKSNMTYPKAPVSDVVEEYHGVKVPDPYRKLEDPDAPETRDWIESENELTQAYLEKIPERKPIRQRLRMWRSSGKRASSRRRRSTSAAILSAPTAISARSRWVKERSP